MTMHARTQINKPYFYDRKFESTTLLPLNSGRIVTDSTGSVTMTHYRDRIVMERWEENSYGLQRTAKHSISADPAISSEERILAHWLGFAYPTN